MFVSTLVAVASIAASANAGLIRRHDFAVPSTYDAPYLEPYQSYHTRYLALSCFTKHNTTFFDQCCHPLLKNEKLETARPAQCIPSPEASSSASAALPTTTIVPDGGDDDLPDCEDGDDEPESSSAPAIATPPANVGADPSPAAPTTPAAKPTSEAKPAPSSEAKPTPSPKPSPSSSKKPAATSSASSSKGPLSSLFSAFSTTSDIRTNNNAIGTFFFQNGHAGNCGTVHQDSDLVIALPTATYANGAHCGKKIAIADKDTGVTAVGVVADSCPTCDNDDCLDLSVALYEKFATQNAGVFNLAWAFID